MKPGLGQGLIDARLIGAERAAPLQQQRDAVEGEPRAQVPALALLAARGLGTSGLSAGRRVGHDLIAQRYRRHALRDRAFHGPYPSVGGCGIRLLPVSGGAIRRNQCGQGALRPTARASAPRPGRRSIGPRGRSQPYAGRRSPSDGGRRIPGTLLTFRAGDLDDAGAWHRERRIGNDGSNVVCRDGLEQAGRNPDYVSIRT